MFRLLMRLVPVVFALAAAGAAWFVTRPGGLFSLGNSPRRSAALAGIAFLIVFLLTWLPGFFYERARRKREKAAEALAADEGEPISFGPLPPIRPTAVTEAKGPYVPQFADDDEDFAPAPAAPLPSAQAVPAEGFAWPTMTAAELGQPEPAPEPVVTPAPAAPAPAFAPAAAAPDSSAPIDELLMRRKADLAAALQRVSSPLAAVAAAVELPVASPPAESPAPAPPPADPAPPQPAATVTPMPPLRQPDPRPAMPLPGMRARIAAIRRELD